MPSPTKKNVAEAQQLERTIERLTGKLESVASLTFKAYSPQTGFVQRDNERHERFSVPLRKQCLSNSARTPNPRWRR